jgi:putative SOS response-associated peptidase YedK
MCHHYVSAKDPPPWVHLVPEFSQRVDFGGWQQRAFWPLDDVPILRLDATGRHELVFLQWGLLPRWWKPSGARVKRSGFQRKCVNAVSEEVADKPSFREAFKERRCLMTASEFAETVGREQWFFHRPDRGTFAIAALWERWRGGDDEVVESCTMLTTAANRTVSSVGQDRMPVIFTTPEQCSTWLNDGLASLDLARQLMRPADDDLLQAYQAAPATQRRTPSLFDDLD